MYTKFELREIQKNVFNILYKNIIKVLDETAFNVDSYSAFIVKKFFLHVHCICALVSQLSHDGLKKTTRSCYEF